MTDRHRAWSLSILVGAAACLCVGGFTGASTGTSHLDVDYTTQVKPIFKANCLRCHGPRTAESNFRVDRRQSFIDGGDYGEPLIQPGKSKQSLLIKIVSGAHDDLVMPPEGKRLSSEQIATLATWIDEGAVMESAGHAEDSEDSDDPLNLWSLQPITAPHPPSIDNTFVGGAIDAFVLQSLQQHELTPSPPADRVSLIRRLYLIMLGVPPSPQEIDRFVSDQRTDAWQQLVDQTLASPLYGERWARHWLDITRFGETDGFETNRERPHAWHYRDWVIDALNQDKPYDQFVLEQLAGDVLDQPVGTGFLVAGPHDIVKSPDINLTLMQRQDELSDIVHTVGTAFLGLTTGCARCHDHKFDPISQKDFYQLQAVFAGVQHGNRAMPKSSEQLQKLNTNAARMAQVRMDLAEFVLDPPPRRFTFVDDTTRSENGGRGLESLMTPKGTGQNPIKQGRGQARDPGSAEHGANLSGGSYTWWENQPETDVAIYRPMLRGPFKIWLSWGCGFDTHTQDAAYLLDRDGDPQTTSDQHLIATIDQQRFAEAQPDQAGSGDTKALASEPLWSGLLDAGEIHLEPNSTILLRGGQTGTAITADLIVLESLAFESAQRRPLVEIRPPVTATHNVEQFTATGAKWVRFSIEQTNNGIEPCLDELEIFSGDENVGLASRGSVATSSGNYADDSKHRLAHVNDGLFGNEKSWISDEKGRGWVQIELPEVFQVDRIQWARDRNAVYSDRLATAYRIEVAVEPDQWIEVASSADRRPLLLNESAQPVYDFSKNEAQAKRGQELRKQLATLIASRQSLSKDQLAYIGTFQQPPPTHRLHRGDPRSKREQVVPDTLGEFGSLNLSHDTPESERRLALARWMVDENNPLTVRVIANRIWQHHFGQGLVRTPSDFGAHGLPPSHPDLLDWLAQDLINHGWSLKHLHRRILLSNSWQQDHAPRPAAHQVDADNRLLWRFAPRRLEAEAIRDSMLAVSGALDLTMGGPGFSAFEVELENVRHYFPKQEYGPSDWRRMIYMTKVRQEQESTFGAFDCPDANQVMPTRTRSTSPLQALNLFNSPFVLQQAELTAQRVRRLAGDQTGKQIQQAFRLCLGRLPSADETEAAAEFVTQHDLRLLCRALLNSNEFLFIP